METWSFAAEYVALRRFCEDDVPSVREPLGSCTVSCTLKAREGTMNFRTKLILGILTALAMFALTFAIPRGGPMRDAQLVQFPLTMGVWSIFVLLFVKLK
jgi:hypothetical protein